MKTLLAVALCACTALANTVYAEGGTKNTPSMQDCKDHMAIPKKDGMKADDSSTKMDKACADLMKNDSSSMKKDGMKSSSGSTAEKPAAPSK